MNTITKTPEQKKHIWTGKLKDLIGVNFRTSRTAFIGTCGTEEDRLFLINYDCIAVAEEPDQTWSCDNCNVEVIRFVDVNITVIGESKNE